MVFKRTNSMPEARHLLQSSFLPNNGFNLEALHEEGEYESSASLASLAANSAANKSTVSININNNNNNNNNNSISISKNSSSKLGGFGSTSNGKLKSTSSFLSPDTENDLLTDQTVEDDFGFFPMDDEDDDEDDQYNTDRAVEQAREREQEQHKQDQRRAMQEDKEKIQRALSQTTQEDADADADVSVLGSSLGSVSNSSRTTTTATTTNGRHTRKKRSALKRGSAYGDSEEGIPLDFERREFNKVLPKPDFSQRESSIPTPKSKGMVKSRSRGLFRVSSEPVFVRPVYQPDHHIHDDDHDHDEQDQDQDNVTLFPQQQQLQSSSFVEGAMKKRISFGTIQIREHAQTIGDNPSCTYGTPVQLDWASEDLQALPVEDYEAYRPETARTKEEFHLNHFQRMNVLKLNGYSTNEIKEHKKKTTKARNQRERTKFMQLNYPQLTVVEDAITSGVRKMKRSVSKFNTNTNTNTTLRDNDLSPPKSLNILEMMDNDVSNVTAPSF